MDQIPKIAARCLALLALLAPVQVLAQQAFNDSLQQLSSRVAERALGAELRRLAVSDITAPGGSLEPALLTYVEEVLIMRLTQRPGVTVVERRALEQVMEEQRRTASGQFDDESAIELGRLLAADAIVTGKVFKVDKGLHIILRLLDTGTGALLGTEETFTDFPKGKEPGRSPGTSTPDRQPLRLKREGPGSERVSILEARVLGMGAAHFGRGIGGGALEIAVRSREQDGGRVVPGRLGVGAQLGFWPSIGAWKDPSFDVGYISNITSTDGFIGTPNVRFGDVEMPAGRIFLMPKGPENVFIQYVNGAGQQGTEELTYERHAMRNVRMDMVGLNIPLRWYLGRNHIYDNVPKLYAEFGFGLDMVLVNADYEVTTTVARLDRSDYTYAIQQDVFTGGKPTLASVGSEIWFTHFSAGGGVEFGRFNVFALGRWFVSTTFREPGREYDRVRGNILAFPLLAGADDDGRTLADLERNGAVPYGATDLEKITGSDATGEGTTVSGNGVDRFWQRGYFTFGLSFRFL